MKRYLIPLTALSLLTLATGCQKEHDGIDNRTNNQSAAVNVLIDGLSIDATTSRSVIEDMPNFETNMFTIAGYYTFGNADASTSGLFDDNAAEARPNVFDYQGEILGSNGESVIKPEVKEGKYTVTLSKWQLQENSFLSYFAWASNVKGGANPIQSATVHNDKGAPFIKVLSGTPSASYNVDVVAAKSANHSNDVVRSSIDLDFKHIMTKLKFNVKNISSADMILTGAKILFAAGKVSRGATYLFDGNRSPVGTWGEYADNTEAISYAVTPTSINLASKAAAVHLEELLIIPQALVNGAISVELTYTIPNGASVSTYTRTKQLEAKTVEQNTSYTYEISLNETTMSISEGRIGSWIETTGDLPYIAGPRDPNVQLLLDAYDPPYTHTDGNKYWLDRSGWNRHCKLVGGVKYDTAGKFYSFTDNPVGASYLDVPRTFTSTSAGVTFETIVRSTRSDGETSAQNVFNFTGSDNELDRIMYTHFNYNGAENYYFDAGGKSTSEQWNRVNSFIPMNLYREFAMYSFTKGPTTQSVRRNLLYVNNTLTSGVQRAADLSKATLARIGTEFKGEIKYFKISSKEKTSIDVAEYAALSKRHKVKDTNYVGKDLLFDIRGTDPPVGISLVDRVKGYKSSTFGGKDANKIYNADKKEYDIAMGMEMVFDFPDEIAKADFKNMTFEFIAYRPIAGDDWFDLGVDDNVVWKQSDGSNGDYSYGVYVRLSNVHDTHAFICSPMNVNWSQYFIKYEYPGSVHGYQAVKRHYCVTREALSNRMTILYAGNAQVGTRTDGLSVVIPETKRFRASGVVKISAVRIYNRKLADWERNWNYQADKATYNIP